MQRRIEVLLEVPVEAVPRLQELQRQVAHQALPQFKPTIDLPVGEVATKLQEAKVEIVISVNNVACNHGIHRADHLDNHQWEVIEARTIRQLIADHPLLEVDILKEILAFTLVITAQEVARREAEVLVQIKVVHQVQKEYTQQRVQNEVVHQVQHQVEVEVVRQVQSKVLLLVKNLQGRIAQEKVSDLGYLGIPGAPADATVI